MCKAWGSKPMSEREGCQWAELCAFICIWLGRDDKAVGDCCAAEPIPRVWHLSASYDHSSGFPCERFNTAASHYWDSNFLA